MERSVYVIYRNWRGSVDLRHIIPQYVEWGTTEYHKTPGWLMTVFDLDRDCQRTFTMRDILNFDVGPEHPARCDAPKWATMREALMRPVVTVEDQGVPTIGRQPVFPELRSRLEVLIATYAADTGFASHVQHLLGRVNEREAYGVNKYKQTLLTHDGRDNAKDCEDEALDLAVYMVKAAMQGEDLHRLQLTLRALGLVLHRLIGYRLNDKEG